MLAVDIEQTFVLLNWAQFLGVLSMMNTKQNQFKNHRIAPDVYKPGEIRKFNFHGNIHHRYTFCFVVYPTVISYSAYLLLLLSSFEVHCLKSDYGIGEQ